VSLALPEALFFTGIDWAAATHAVCVMDAAGEIIAEFTIAHSADGIAQLIRRLARYGDPAALPSLAESRLTVRETVAVGLTKQLPERRHGGRLVRAGLLEAPRLAGNRVGTCVDVDAVRPARELLDVPSRDGGHDTTISRITDIRSTTRSTKPIDAVRFMLSTWEPPIGIEPMTYALRVRRSNRLS
jgi:hypothetical protein